MSCSLCTSWVCLETGVALLQVAEVGQRGVARCKSKAKWQAYRVIPTAGQVQAAE